MDKTEVALNYKSNAPNMAAVVSTAANNLELAALRCVIDSRPPAVALREGLLPRLKHIQKVVAAAIEIIEDVAPEKSDG